MPWFETINLHRLVLGLGSSDPLVDGEVHHVDHVVGDDCASIILRSIPGQLAVPRPHLVNTRLLETLYSFIWSRLWALKSYFMIWNMSKTYILCNLENSALWRIVRLWLVFFGSSIFSKSAWRVVMLQINLRHGTGEMSYHIHLYTADTDAVVNINIWRLQPPDPVLPRQPQNFSV